MILIFSGVDILPIHESIQFVHYLQIEVNLDKKNVFFNSIFHFILKKNFILCVFFACGLYFYAFYYLVIHIRG